MTPRGAAFFWVPGVGPLLLAGPVAARIIGALEGAVVVGGLSILGPALYSAGIRKDSSLTYETAVKADKYLLVIHAIADEAAKAKDILSRTKPAEVTDHALEPVPQAA